MAVEVEGWTAVLAAMAQAAKACEQAGARAADEAARALAAQTAPTLPVRTGTLRASVHTEATEGGSAVVIGAPYAVFVRQARAMARSAEPAAADYARRAHARTETEIARLPWP